MDRISLTAWAQSIYWVLEQMACTKKKYYSKKFKASTSPFNLCRRTRISIIFVLRLVPNKVLGTLLLALRGF